MQPSSIGRVNDMSLDIYTFLHIEYILISYTGLEYLFRFTPGYPDTLPVIRVEKGPGLSDTNVSELDKLVQRKAHELLGREMVYELATTVQEYLSARRRAITSQPTVSFHDAMLTRHRQDEEVLFHLNS